jgi:heme/copper-type cytochrome/quinol oxidase subunit 2
MRNRYSATLLLALPYVVAMLPAFANPVQAIAITVSGSAISPERIEVRAGTRVRLALTSADGAHALQIKGLRLTGRIPAAGETVTFDLLPTDPGTFRLECLDDGGRGEGNVGALLVVKR